MARPASRDAPRVRMYRHGLGDCFLVTLPGVSARPFHMLIDCGLQMGAPDEAGTMERVAKDIEATTEGRLDIVVVSHDHWNQVSGFALARSVFARVAIGEVWFGWAEDPTDPLAGAVAANRGRHLRGLRALANRLARSSPGDERGPALAAELSVPLGFYGPRDGAVGRRAIECLKDHPSGPRVRYGRVGGSAIRLSGSASASAFVLAPSPEKAPSLANPSALLHFLAAAGNPSDGDDEGAVQSDAFDDRYRLSPKRAERLPFFRRRYLADDEAWRRVDRDWMAAGAPLALALDGHGDNLSLALAIEVEPGGAVLLFPGAARTEDWAGWARLNWRRAGVQDEATATGADLLARTALYKVGHHGAARAAPGPEGIGLMTSPDLVAMLSVDQEFAEKSGWRMPEPRLLDQLLRVSRGRLLRSDRPFPERPEFASAGEWRVFRDAVVFDPNGLHVDFHLGGRPGLAGGLD